MTILDQSYCQFCRTTWVDGRPPDKRTDVTSQATNKAIPPRPECYHLGPAAKRCGCGAHWHQCDVINACVRRRHCQTCEQFDEA
ncbi:hypothetical protein [Planctomycetes bacterium Pan216]